LGPSLALSRCFIQSNNPETDDSTGYLIVEAKNADSGRSELFSFGFNPYGCLGQGTDPNEKSRTFNPVMDLFDQVTHFEELFLAPNIALAVDNDQTIWMIGGKADLQADWLFPFQINEINYFPQATKVSVNLFELCKMPETSRIKRVTANTNTMVVHIYHEDQTACAAIRYREG
jgi:hypothetical protein